MNDLVGKQNDCDVKYKWNRWATSAHVQVLVLTVLCVCFLYHYFTVKNYKYSGFYFIFHPLHLNLPPFFFQYTCLLKLSSQLPFISTYSSKYFPLFSVMCKSDVAFPVTILQIWERYVFILLLWSPSVTLLCISVILVLFYTINVFIKIIAFYICSLFLFRCNFCFSFRNVST